MEAKVRYRDKQNAAEYNEDRFGGEFGEYIRRAEVELYRSLIDGRPGTLLDVGAGTGKLSLPLVQNADHVISSDFAAEMLAIAKSDADQERLPVRFVVADAQNLCFADDSFDTVVSSRMLMHVPHWEKALAELLRVARTTAIFDFPPRSSFATVDVVIKKIKAPFVPGTWTHRTLKIGDVRNELAKHGYRVAAEHKDWFLPVAFHRKLDRPRLTQQLEELCSFLGLRKLFGAPVTIKAVRVGAPKPSNPKSSPQPSGPPDGRERETEEVQA